MEVGTVAKEHTSSLSADRDTGAGIEKGIRAV